MSADPTPAAAPSAPAPAEAESALRQQFEAWCVARWGGDRGGDNFLRYPSADRQYGGQYIKGNVEFAWCAYQAAAAREAASVERVREQAASWRKLYRRAINAANGLTNYVEDRPELRRIERELEAMERDARAEDARAELGEKP